MRVLKWRLYQYDINTTDVFIRSTIRKGDLNNSAKVFAIGCPKDEPGLNIQDTADDVALTKSLKSGTNDITVNTRRYTKGLNGVVQYPSLGNLN